MKCELCSKESEYIYSIKIRDTLSIDRNWKICSDCSEDVIGFLNLLKKRYEKLNKIYGKEEN